MSDPLTWLLQKLLNWIMVDPDTRGWAAGYFLPLTMIVITVLLVWLQEVAHKIRSDNNGVE